MKTNSESKFNIWKNSLVGQLLVRFWICHIVFFSLIGSIQFNALKSTLYLSVEQNLVADFHSIRHSMINWLVSKDLPPGRLADLRPGNFVAFYTHDYQLKSVAYSYGRNNELPYFINEKLQFDLYEKAIADVPFIQQGTKNKNYMLMVKPIYIAQSYLLRVPFTDMMNIPSNDDIDQTEKNTEQLPIVGYAVIGEPLSQVDNILQRNMQAYIFNALLIMLFSTLLTAFALQKPLEPLLNISYTARKIAAGRYDLRLPFMKSTSEIEQLRDTLNHMLGQMEQALNIERTAKDRMSRFIADASHELRTPLTSIRGFLEILSRNSNPDRETLEYAHKTMLIETERLIRLTEGLLTLNRISQDQVESIDTATSLEDVLQELTPLFLPLLEDRTLLLNGTPYHKIKTLYKDHYTLPLRSDELKQILYNLLNNAIQHTNSNGKIEIHAETSPNAYTLTVKDNGNGIPEEDLPHIFERFFRGDRSRTRIKGKGSGLGLAIVSEIVKIRGGSITVESQLGKGTAFHILFPKGTVN